MPDAPESDPPDVTTQIPAWRDQSSPGSPSGERAMPGTLIGDRYELRVPIGNGGMGTVWRASDTLLRREVAVKEVLLPPTMPRNEQSALCERTMREARAAAALSHPSVVQVYDVVTDNARPWIVMELLDARSLADMVIEDGPLPQRAVAKIGIAMLGALEVAHAAGVLHRDVKPANVLICADGRCVLTDFGVARLPTESNLTTPGMVLGSPHFISPERAVGGAFGPPSDLFSLGVTLYTAVEGGPPFDRGDPFETMRAVVEEAPRPPRLAGPLRPILMGLLDKEPSRRWDVDHARVALRELLVGQLSRTGPTHTRNETDTSAMIRPITGPPPPPAPPPGPRSPRVGGRAMLDPSEPLTGQLQRLRREHAAPTSPAATPAARTAATSPAATPAARTAPTSPAATSGSRTAAPVRRDQEEEPPRYASDYRYEGDRLYDGEQWHERPASSRGRRRAPSQSAIMARKGREFASDTSRQIRGRVGELRRSGARRSRLAITIGLVAVLAAVGIAVLSGAFSGDDSKSPLGQGSTAPSATATGPAFPVQEFHDDRGLVVNVPQGWTKSGSSYVDFADPAGGRKVRINVEAAGGDAEKFMTSAENGLKKPNVCAAPYQRLALRTDVQLDGKPGAELEYTCGEGADTRHGIWRAVVVNGKAYYFYLTVPDSGFAESKVIYDEMVRSFHLT
jgi:serine/threonine protein kinase